MPEINLRNGSQHLRGVSGDVATMPTVLGEDRGMCVNRATTCLPQVDVTVLKAAQLHRNPWRQLKILRHKHCCVHFDKISSAKVGVGVHAWRLINITQKAVRHRDGFSDVTVHERRSRRLLEAGEPSTDYAVQVDRLRQEKL
jgi:hypothetical protein